MIPKIKKSIKKFMLDEGGAVSKQNLLKIGALTVFATVSVSQNVTADASCSGSTCDKLYDECYKHWKTEEEMYQEGLHQMPFEHKNISKEWAAHQKQHKNFLKQIKTLKKHILMHIKKYDTRDFHWTM